MNGWLGFVLSAMTNKYFINLTRSVIHKLLYPMNIYILSAMIFIAVFFQFLANCKKSDLDGQVLYLQCTVFVKICKL